LRRQLNRNRYRNLYLNPSVPSVPPLAPFFSISFRWSRPAQLPACTGVELREHGIQIKEGIGIVMARKFDIKSMVLGGFLGGIVMFSVAAATTEKAAWDYKIISGHLISLAQQPALGPQLDQATADGWEVVASANDEGRPFVILRKAK